MWNRLKNKNFYFMIGGDAVLFAVSLVLAYFLRFDFSLSIGIKRQVIFLMPFVVFSKVFIFMWFGLYRGMWRYTSFLDMMRLIQAAIVSSMVLVAGILFIFRFEGFSRGVFVIDFIMVQTLCFSQFLL